MHTAEMPFPHPPRATMPSGGLGVYQAVVPARPHPASVCATCKATGIHPRATTLRQPRSDGCTRQASPACQRLSRSCKCSSRRRSLFWHGHHSMSGSVRVSQKHIPHICRTCPAPRMVALQVGTPGRTGSNPHIFSLRNGSRNGRLPSRRHSTWVLSGVSRQGVLVCEDETKSTPSKAIQTSRSAVQAIAEQKRRGRHEHPSCSGRAPLPEQSGP